MPCGIEQRNVVQSMIDKIKTIIYFSKTMNKILLIFFNVLISSFCPPLFTRHVFFSDQQKYVEFIFLSSSGLIIVAINNLFSR